MADPKHDEVIRRDAKRRRQLRRRAWASKIVWWLSGIFTVTVIAYTGNLIGQRLVYDEALIDQLAQERFQRIHATEPASAPQAVAPPAAASPLPTNDELSMDQWWNDPKAMAKRLATAAAPYNSSVPPPHRAHRQ